MERYLFYIDNISEWSGKAFAWCIILLTATTSYDVLARYLFSAPTDWAYDMEYILYGSLFMMAGAYTLSRNGHVRGDVLYGFFPPRLQAGLDLVLYLAFFIPGIAALAYSGIDYAKFSWSLNEHSSVTPGGPPLYPYKTLIPIAGALVLLQGIAEIIRCIQCLQTGEWPRRASDVEEVDVEELKKMVHMENVDVTAEIRFTEGEPPPLRQEYEQNKSQQEKKGDDK